MNENQKNHARATPHKSVIEDETKQAHPVKVSTILIMIIPVGVLVALPAIVHALTK